jgi:very-short-patch-repair endonuclease
MRCPRYEESEILKRKITASRLDLFRVALITNRAMEKQPKESTMFYGAKPKNFQFAKQNRDSPTKCEAILWKALSNKKLAGFRFKRQHPVGKYILDFYCHKLKLSIEVDGMYHSNADQMEYDKFRSSELLRLGIQELRFSNREIEHSLNNVIDKILVSILEKSK